MTQKITEAKKYRIYGTVALIVLFLIGIFVGWTLDNGKKTHFKKIGMPEYKCDDIASQLLNAARSNNAQLVKELNEVYSQNCNHVVEVKPQQPQKQVNKKLPERDCEAIEQLLKEGLVDENTQNYEYHYNNADVYTKLANVACEENRDKYMELAQRENKIANVLSGQMSINMDSTCEKIESILLKKIRNWDDMSADMYVENAETYANLAERGCEQNKQKYTELAQQQLAIARALTDDKVPENYNATKEMIQVYKRIQMKQEAQKIIDKAKKIADPAIDFIIQLEKIIEE